MDATRLLQRDHEIVEKLFRRFETAGVNAKVRKRDIVDRIIGELSTHAAIEEQVFYPAARACSSEAEGDVLEALEEHHIVKWVLSELEHMQPTDERFDAKVTVLIENVRHHVEEEEDELFPLVREAMGRKKLKKLGDALAGAKRVAPTHPHPRSPDTPPGNVLAGAATGLFDRVGDTAGRAAGEVLSTAKDVIAEVTGESAEKRLSSPAKRGARSRGGRGTTATTTARKTAAKKTAAKKTAAKKAVATKVAAKKTAAKKAVATKRAPAKRTTASKTAARKTTATKVT